MENQLAIITESDLSFVDNNALNAKQLGHILKSTPAQYVKQRPAKGGGTWEYVTGGYVKKCLNLMFGFDWDFEILEDKIIHGEAIVKGRLTCRSGGRTIIKTQYGNKDIMCKKGTDNPLSIGNDLKAAATDCLKKCAAEIGIAADIYNKEDFRPIIVQEDSDTLVQIKNLIELKNDVMTTELVEYANRIIDNNESKSFSKLLKELKAL